MMVILYPFAFKPTRNAYGLLGWDPQSGFTDDAIKQKLLRRQMLAGRYMRLSLI